MGYALSALPTSVGYAMANLLADRIASLKQNAMVRACRANQWVVHGEKPDSDELDELVRQTCRSTARSLYEFWHYATRPQGVLQMVRLDPSFERCYCESKATGQGLLMVAPHMSNFDLVGRAVGLSGYQIHVLSYPQPPGGYRLQNNLREVPGIKITPVSVESLRMASDTLRSGGVVLTGIDRPLSDSDKKYRPRFFGRPATLPVFVIRLALKHDLPIVVLGGRRNSDCTYTVWASDPIRMNRQPDLVQEIVNNAEAVLEVVADHIRRAPNQWAMFYPVWPEALEEMPK